MGKGLGTETGLSAPVKAFAHAVRFGHPCQVAAVVGEADFWERQMAAIQQCGVGLPQVAVAAGYERVGSDHTGA